MQLNLKTELFNNVTLKIVSCFLGYAIWLTIGQSHSTSMQISVPLCFYAMPENYAVNAPETLTLELRGKRADLRNIDTQALALHIQGQDLQEGPNQIPISTASLFLPDDVKLVNYFPSNSCITIRNTDEPKAAVTA